MTPAIAATTFLAICTAICTVATTVNVLLTFIGKIKAPNAEQNNRISALEKRCDKYDEYFANDKTRMTNIELEVVVLTKGMFALLSNAVDGADIDRCKQAKIELQDFLATKGVKV